MIQNNIYELQKKFNEIKRRDRYKVKEMVMIEFGRSFKTLLDREENSLEILDFDDIKEKLYCKLKTLAFIKAIRKFDNKKEYFKYYDLKIYTLKGFKAFLSLIENDTIKITFKIGTSQFYT